MKALCWAMLVLNGSMVVVGLVTANAVLVAVNVLACAMHANNLRQIGRDGR